MFQSILRFMQNNDKDGDWLSADETEKEYILETIYRWIVDGLEVNERIKEYIHYLNQ